MNPYNVTESIEYKTLKSLQEHNLDVFVKKNHDYGDSFFKVWNKMGDDAILSAYSRISDKYNRFEHYALSLRHAEGLMVGDESIVDTLIDMGNYCLMTAVAIELSKNSKPVTDLHESLVSQDVTSTDSGKHVEFSVYDTISNNTSMSNTPISNNTSMLNTPNPNVDVSRINIPRRNTNGNF